MTPPPEIMAEIAPLVPLYAPLREKYHIHDGEKVWELPGSGAVSEGCGEPVSYRCPKCGKWLLTQHSCMQRLCKRCSRKWARKEARKAVARIRDYEDSVGGCIRGVIRGAVTFDFMPTVEEEKLLRRRVIAQLHRAGFKAFALIKHPWREDKDGEYNVEGFHYHFTAVVCEGEYWERGDDFHARTGWNLIVFRQQHGTKWFVPMKGLYRALEYDLDHCGFSGQGHAVYWCGGMGYNQMAKGRRELKASEKPQVLCPDCKTPMLIVRGGLEGDDFEDRTSWPAQVVRMWRDDG